jgi:hypothetical protein
MAQIDPSGMSYRIIPDAWPQDPSLLWISPQADWGQGAFVHADGKVYVFGCYQRAAWDDVCRIARAEAGQLAQPAGWRYWTGTSWSEHMEDSTVVLQGTLSPTAAWNADLGKVLVVYARTMSNDVMIRTAPDPSSPYGEEQFLFTAQPPKEWWIRDLHLHMGLSAGDTSGVLLSYYSEPAEGESGMYFVKVRFDKDLLK